MSTALKCVTLSVTPSGIMTVTMNRLKQKNAFNNQMYLDLTTALDQAAKSDSVHAVVVTGGGGW
jgi:enoyl-CoA hydratase/carnithine racemase